MGLRNERLRTHVGVNTFPSFIYVAVGAKTIVALPCTPFSKIRRLNRLVAPLGRADGLEMLFAGMARNEYNIFLIESAHMLRKTLSLLSCFLMLAIASAAISHAEAKQSLLTSKTNEQNLVALPGHVYPLAIPRYDRGPVADSLQFPHMVLVLKRSAKQEQALTTLIDQLHDSKSPMYHRWLSPQEFGQFFGPSDQDLQKLTSWLEGSGFKVDEISPGRTTIIFSGNAAQVRQSFGTAIHRFNVNGVRHVANVSNPQIPLALAGLVAGFRSLNDFQAKPLHHLVGGFTKDKSTGDWKQSSAVSPNLTSLAGPIGDARLVGPQDFYTIYNLKPLLDSGINGAGQTIAVIEQSDVNPADVTAFRAQFGLPAYPATPNATQGGVNYFRGVPSYCSDPGIVPGDEDEAILDAEWAGAIAPNATIDVVSCASSGSSQGTDLALTYIVNHLASTVSAMSYSYGACEAALGGASNAFYKNVYQQAVAQGQTVVVSTGDGGAPGCDNFSVAAPNPATQGNAVNGLASTAYNIAAGGTDFSDVYQNLTNTYWNATNGPGYGSARSYVPETAWNGSCAGPVLRSYAAKLGLNPGATPEAWCNNANFKAKYGSFVFLDGGSGGASSLYAKPSWQSAYGVPNDFRRDVPDISLFASNFIYSHALAVCQSDRGYACDMSNSSVAQTMAGGGTSFVAPEVAGLIALVNQKTNTRQGQANYTLYALAASEYGSPAAPNLASLDSCNGSQKGNVVGTSCMFYDVNATPNPNGGTVTDTISQPCAVGSPNCVASVKKDAYGLLSSSSSSQVAAYPVGKGYDLATGLGSINFTNLVNNWTTGGTSGPSTFKTTTTLVAAPTTITQGGATTLTATVTNSTYASPNGIVNFYNGGATGTMLGTATLVPGRAPTATASLQVPGTMLDPGSNNLIAVFPGDGANDAASSSSTVSVNVGLVANGRVITASTLSTSVTSLFAMQSIAANVAQIGTVTVTISPTPFKGTVQLALDGIAFGTPVAVSTTPDTILTLDLSTLAVSPTVGAHQLTATYSGHGNYDPSTTTATTVNVFNNTATFGSVNVGSTSQVQQFNVTFRAASTVGSISDLTVGSSNKDYLDDGSTTCTAASYALSATCTLSMFYQPTVPGTRLGSAVLYDGSNAPIVTIPATGTGVGPLLSFGFAAPTATISGFNGPSSVSVDGTGNMFVSDTLNNRVVEIASGGFARNVGTGFTYPVGTAVDGAGNLYVADATFGIAKIPNENGILNAAHQASLSIAGGVSLPGEMAFDSIGNLFIADAFNNRVIKLLSVNGSLDVANPTYVGTGLTGPTGVAVDAAGNVFIADTGFPSDPVNGIFGRILKIPGGTGSQQSLSINVNGPSSIAIDASGQLFISDTNNSRILQISSDLSSQTTLNTSINATNPPYFGGLSLDLKGNLWAPDFLNNQVVRLAPNAPLLDLGIVFFAPGTLGPATVPVSNIGNSTLDIYGFNPPAYFSQNGGTCLAGALVAPGQNCTLSIIFQATSFLQGGTGSFNIRDNVNNQTATTPHVDTVVVSGFSIFGAPPAAPTVASSSPINKATNVPTSTHSSNNVVTGTLITATFSESMNPSTINSSPAGTLLTFTLKKTSGVNVPGTVAMNASNTVATFTPTASALTPNTSYTATVSNAAKNAGGTAMSSPVVWTFTTKAVPFAGQVPVNLGTAGTFAILTQTGITDVYASTINGDVGTSPITGTALGLTCGEVQTGTVYTVDATGPLPCRVTDPTVLTAAVGDMGIAYTDAAGRTLPNSIELGAGQIGGLTLAPGLYKWSTGLLISTDVTLSGGPDDVWIFQIAGTLNQANATRVNLVGGAVPKNIFWQSAGAVTIGTTAHFEGIILAKTLVAVNTGASANSRLLAQTAVTLQQNSITQPAP